MQFARITPFSQIFYFDFTLYLTLELAFLPSFLKRVNRGRSGSPAISASISWRPALVAFASIRIFKPKTSQLQRHATQLSGRRFMPKEDTSSFSKPKNSYLQLTT